MKNSKQNLAPTDKPFYILVGRPDLLPLAQEVKKHFNATIMAAGGDDDPSVEPLVNDSIVDSLHYLYQLAVSHRTPLLAFVNGGIIMRALGGVVAGHDKFSSPAILYLASDQRTLVPLMGEHHGGQTLGLALVEKICAEKTDKEFSLSYAGDSKPHDDDIADNYFMAGKEFLPAWLLAKKSIATDWHNPPARCPQIIPPALSIGVGLERGAPLTAVKSILQESLQKINAHPRAVARIASIDIKIDEVALHQLAEDTAIPLRFFTSEELAAVPVPNPSAVVEKETGSPSVAEAASLLAAGYDKKNQPTLLLEKQKANGVTIAISEILPDKNLLSGFTLGHLAVVGIGPGDKNLRSPLASHYILAASDIVGYQLYLDLVLDLTLGKTLHEKNLGQEEARAALALDLALAGKKTVLLASGDAGIYALATLVWQLLAARKAENPTDKKLSAMPITVVPGVSAFQALAARLGAPAGNDIAMISLSNIMTPRDKILQRVRGALQGDFPIFLYNPKSKTRSDILLAVVAMAKEFLPPTSKVVIGKNLYRANEEIIVSCLDDFSIDNVDMFSCVMIANSTMRHFNHLGKDIFYAPRGY